MESSVPQLLPLLKQYFGFTSFRPLQEEIIRDALAGKDVFALLPTGGGKSLCFQLPAMARAGLTVVVSPLIALDEGPGGCVAGERRAGHLPQFLAGGGRIAGAAARAAYRAVPAALRGAGAADALGVSVRFAAVGGEPVGH